MRRTKPASMLVVAMLAAFGPVALAEPADQRCRLKEGFSNNRTTERRDFVERWSGDPLDRPRSEFTADERPTFRSAYNDMPEDDEPPFPVRGVGPLIVKARDAFGRSEGSLTIFANVDAAGDVSSVSLVTYPSMGIAKSFAVWLMKTKFKPAVCSGQPCAMEFPFRIRVRRSD